MCEACYSRDSPTTLCQPWLIRWKCHIIDGSIGNSFRICLIMNAFVRGGSRHPRYLKGFSWLWKCFGIQGFGVQGTSYKINEAKEGVWFFEVRHGLLFMILEACNYIDSRILSTFHQLRFGKFHKPSNNIWKMIRRKG